MADISKTVEAARKTFESGRTKDVSFRVQQLRALRRLFAENMEEMYETVKIDLGKSRLETIVTELGYAAAEIDDLISNTEKWTKPERPGRGVVNYLDDVYICKEPLGVVLILSAWNMPYQLTLLPLGGAIAAGNCVIIKPSEMAPHSARLMERLVSTYLDPLCYKVVTGGVDVSTELLKHQFDHIFFTGSVTVGKIVLKAAAEHLTPVTLEMGGKNAVYLDSTVKMDLAVKRIIWGKIFNAGQTCVAPDYVICTLDVQKQFLKHSAQVLKEFFGSDVSKSPDYPRIISDKQFQRLANFIKTHEVAHGGKMDEMTRFIEPTIIVNVKPNDLIMNEEIFGPILPIVIIEDVQEAIKLINSKPTALTLYIFSNNQKSVELLLENTSSGGVCINDTVIHTGVERLPFGGVGASGMGAYHGKHSFDTFVHKKGVLAKKLEPFYDLLLRARYPPYDEGKTSYLLYLLLNRPRIFFPEVYRPLCYVALYGAGILTSYWIQKYNFANPENPE